MAAGFRRAEIQILGLDWIGGCDADGCLFVEWAADRNAVALGCSCCCCSLTLVDFETLTVILGT